MSTLIEAVERVREQGQLPPDGPVSIRDLLQRFPPSPQGSVRALLLKMFGLNPTTRWGIVVVTLTGVPRTTSLPLNWFERLFGDGDGVSSYFRQISGTRQVFSWRVFGPHDMYTPAKKAELVAQGASAESSYLRMTAATKGVPVNDFDRFIWVMDQPESSGGTAGGGDLFIAAADLTHQIVSHEIAHAFGVVFEGDRYVDGVVQTYGDLFCPMDRGPSARSFQNYRLDYTHDGNNHQTSGPVMCAPHIFVMGWLDYPNNVVERASDTTNGYILIDVNQGAPALGRHVKVALVVQPVPQNMNSSQFWIEYRLPVGFDRWVDRPVSTNNIDMPEGALVMHEMRPDRHVILVNWTRARSGNTLKIPGTRHSVEIMSPSEVRRNIVLRIREAGNE